MIFSKFIRFFLGGAVLASTSLQAQTNLFVDLSTDNDPTGMGQSSTLTSGDLRYVLNLINELSSPDSYNVTFTTGPATIILQGIPPIINLAAKNTVTINGGSNIAISGQVQFPTMIVRQGSLTLENITLENGLSSGGVGNAGALGAGGGLLIIGGTTTLNNVSFLGNFAVGGGANTTYNGGAGMFKGYSVPNALGAGGMGGLGGPTTGTAPTGGGGIGQGTINSVGQGGAVDGSGIGLPGQNGTGFHAGFTGGNSESGGGDNSGGGGGGFTPSSPFFGGAGGGVNQTQIIRTPPGGAGGFGGGGGAGYLANSGNGGFGGGGAGSITAGTTCGSGGFGGSGGGGVSSTATPGAGGFGAGGGSTGSALGASGIGGGLSTPAGGAAFGGAIFVNPATDSSYYNGNDIEGGANLVITGPVTISGGGVMGGGSGAGTGAAVGADIFSTKGTGAITFSVASGTLTYTGSIFDDSLGSVHGGTWQPGSGPGAEVVITGGGTVALGGTSGYSGGTNLSQGTLQVLSNGCLGNANPSFPPVSPLNFTGTGVLTLQAGAGGITIPNPIVTNSTTNQFDSNTFNLTLSGEISGSGTLNKIGAGTLTLTNTANSYSGPTNIQVGTLALSGTGNLPSTTAVNLSSNTVFSIVGISGSTTIGDLTSVDSTGLVNLGSNQLIFGTSNSIVFPGLISGTGGQLTKQGTGTVQLTNNNTYTGLTTISNGTLQITTSNLNPGDPVNIASLGVLNINQTTAGTFSGPITGAGSLLISGGTGCQVQLTGANNYTGGTKVDANCILYGPTTSIQGNIANSGTVDFEGPGGTFSGVISGTGLVEINNFSGSGTVSFSMPQTYTGNTSIVAGTLALTGTGSISTSPVLQMASGTTFDISGLSGSPTSTTVGQLSNVSGGTIVLGTNTLITSTSTTPVTYGGVISGTGGFTKQGTGVLILTTPSPLFTGTMTISAGTLQINPNTLVSTIVDNANLDFEQPTGSGTYTNVISGTGNVQINGAATSPGTGTVIFSGLNTYTGTTTVAHGNLVVSQSATHTFTGPFIVNSGTSVDFEQATGFIGTFTGNISGGGNVAINQSGTNAGTVILSGALTNTGTTHVYTGTLELLHTASVTSTTNFIVDLGATIDFEQGASSTGLYTGTIQGAGGVIVNQGPNTGTIILTGVNTYMGPTIVYNGGLEIQNSTTTTFVSPITIMSSGILDLEQVAMVGTFSGGLAGSGTLEINEAGSTGTIFLTGPTTFSGTTTVFNGTLAGDSTSLPAVQPINVNTGGTVDIEQATGTGTFAGVIQDNGPSQHGAVAINQLGGTGTVILSGANSYSGGTTVYNGTLQGTPSSLEGTIAVYSTGTVDIEEPIGSGVFTGTIIDAPGQHGMVTINKAGGAGTIIYSTPNTYSGGTTIYGGALQTMPGFVTGNISIQPGAILDFEQPSSSGTFGGNISGGGQVIVNSISGNIGTVILTGTNSYTGGTLVDSGTLQGNTNSLVGAITDNATVIFAQTTNGTFNGSISGPGNLNITGAGIVTFNTASPLLSGTTTITNGSLNLNSTLGGNVIVAALGTLSGTGNVLGNVTVQNTGTVSPGNPNTNTPGTLSIGGNYVQNAGGELNILVTPTGQNSALNITGSAALNNGSNLLITPINGVPELNTIYTIVTATGGVNGTFTNVHLTSGLILPVVTYDSQHVYLELILDFATISTTSNQQQVANQLSTIGPNSSQALKNILQQLASIPADQASLALSQMSAEQYTNILLTSELANRQFIRRLYDPLRTIITTNPCKPVAGCNYVQNYDTWVTFSGGRTFIHGNENARGLRIADFEVSGGAQLTFNKRWTAGVALAYEKDSINYKVGGTDRARTILGGLYSLYRHKRFYALADLVIGYSTNRVKRVIDVGDLSFRPIGHPKVYQYSGYTEIGTEFSLDNTLVQPFLGIEWGYYRYGAFSENCGSPLDVAISQKSKTNAYSRLGVHITTPPLRCGFSMNIDLAWQCRLTSLQNSINVQFIEFGTPFITRGAPFYRNSYEAIVQFNQTVSKRWELFTEASCQGWKDSTTFSFMGGIKTTW